MSDQQMTIEELAEKLRAVVIGDPELDHFEADRLLLRFIAQMPGGEKVIEAFDDIEKWYS